MKGKIAVIISIGLTALILSMVMFTQFKTVEETDITAIETMRETELRAELASWKQKYEEIETKIDERNQKISEYKEELEDGANESTVLENEIKEAEGYLGYLDLKGEGIIVTLQDTEYVSIMYSDLLTLVNELNSAGAEAISINDERITSRSEITLINNTFIFVNAKRIAGPYVVKAIGDKKYLESALTIKGGFIDLMENEEKNISYSVEDSVTVLSTEKRDTLKYAREYSESKE